MREVNNDPFSLVRSRLRTQLFSVFDGFFSIDGMDQNGTYSLFAEVVGRDMNRVQDLIDKVDIQDLRNAEPLIEELFGNPSKWRAGSEFLRSFETKSRLEMEEYFSSLKEQVLDVSFALRELSDETLKDAVKEFDRIAKGLRTPFEEAVDDFLDIERLREIGVRINPVVEARFADQVIDRLSRELEQEAQKQQVIRLNAAAEIRGSAGEFSSRVAVKFQDSERQERRNQHVEAIREMRNQNASLSDIRGFMEKLVSLQGEEERVRLGVW
jgi:hypothetical protein